MIAPASMQISVDILDLKLLLLRLLMLPVAGDNGGSISISGGENYSDSEFFSLILLDLLNPSLRYFLIAFNLLLKYFFMTFLI